MQKIHALLRGFLIIAKFENVVAVQKKVDIYRRQMLYFKYKTEKKKTILKLIILKGYKHMNVFFNYCEPNHVPAGLIKQFLDQYMPTSNNH